LPAGKTDQGICTHCIYCFAGSHHAAVTSAPPGVFHLVSRTFVSVIWPAVRQARPGLPAYLIAHPRGPPLQA
jgi:hypothetical protein